MLLYLKYVIKAPHTQSIQYKLQEKNVLCKFVLAWKCEDFDIDIMRVAKYLIKFLSFQTELFLYLTVINKMAFDFVVYAKMMFWVFKLLVWISPGTHHRIFW